MNAHRKKVFFSGKVQGVGFRYKTRQVATGYEVTGFVRNLPDGRVELVVEGAAPEVEGFLENLQDSMSVFIRKAEIHDEPAESEFHGFEIIA